MWRVMTLRSKKKEKGNFSKLLIVVIAVMIIVFTAVIFYVAAKYGVMVPDALIYAWFGFWSIELVNLTVIKTKKIKETNQMYSPELDEKLREDDENNGKY